MKDSVRPGDTAARLAGDEFVIILEPLKRSGDAALYRVKEAGRGRWLVEA